MADTQEIREEIGRAKLFAVEHPMKPEHRAIHALLIQMMEVRWELAALRESMGFSRPRIRKT